MNPFLTWLVKLITPFILDRIASVLREQYAQKKQREAEEAKAKASVTPLQEAQTGEQIDAATKKALDDF